ncbi:ABC transporter ATP-binding protein [Bacillus sp. Bva_UNVM-123]|uniref:ABC transporter ATP-binding protein n=1 Tax=Bacillus sp. Bva_UNVM-123 TaxID=2829798 RepID=UPI00391F98AA
MSSIITTQKIIKKFNNYETILKGIDLSIAANSFTVILGPSGSGKSTLLNIMSGLLQPTSGSVLYKGQEITKMNDKKLALWKRNEVSHIFQNYLLLSNLTAAENIRLGLSPKTTPLPYKELTKTLGIDTILDKFPSQLSGGQQQRVAIARAVIKKPNLLFCDEATGSLDEENSKGVIALLHEIKQQYGVTTIFITHNLRIADTADRVITLKDGLVIKDEHNENPITAHKMVWG